MRRATTLLVGLVLAGCGPTLPVETASTTNVSPGPTAAPPTAAVVDRGTGWRSDLEALVPGMAARHPKLDHGTPTADLQAAVAALEARIPNATDDELMVGVLGIVAMVSAKGCDAHTGAFIWGTGTYPVESLPLRLWWFDDGLYVVDALDPYPELIGRRIETIEGKDAGDVLAAIDPIVPRDNDSTVRLLMPRFVLIPQVLRGLGLADAGAIDLGLAAPDGTMTTAAIQPIAIRDYNAWAGPYGLHLPANPDVLYLSRIGDAIWWQRLPDDASTLFVQYNRVDRIASTDLAPLETELADPAVERVVVDIRHNYGGEVSALDVVLDLIRQRAVTHPATVYLVTGRNTFSAASLFAARLLEISSVTLLGEPMGGCPTAYGDSNDFVLPFSGIAVSVSSTLEVGVLADDTRPTIEPDTTTPLTPEAWAAGTDPALAAIAASGP